MVVRGSDCLKFVLKTGFCSPNISASIFGQDTLLKFPFLFSKVENICQISLSPLKGGEMKFGFLLRVDSVVTEYFLSVCVLCEKSVWGAVGWLEGRGYKLHVPASRAKHLGHNPVLLVCAM